MIKISWGFQKKSEVGAAINGTGRELGRHRGVTDYRDVKTSDILSVKGKEATRMRVEN